MIKKATGKPFGISNGKLQISNNKQKTGSRQQEEGEGEGEGEGNRREEEGEGGEHIKKGGGKPKIIARETVARLTACCYLCSYMRRRPWPSMRR